MIEALASLDLAYPEIDQPKLKELAASEKEVIALVAFVVLGALFRFSSLL